MKLSSARQKPWAGLPPGMLIAAGLILLQPFNARSQTVSVIFDDDPGSSTYRDASVGFVGNGDFLQRVGDKMPVTTDHFYSGTQSGVIRWSHVTNGFWELYIASNAWQVRDFSGYDSLVFYLNGPGEIPAAEMPRLGMESANNNSKSSILQLSAYCTLDADSMTWQRVAIPFSAFEPYGDFLLSQFKTVRFLAGGVTSATRTLWIDLLSARKPGSQEPLPPLSGDQLLDTLQYTAFRYFWDEANPTNGMVRDRSTPSSPASIAAVGFGLTAIGVGIDHGWITRSAGRDRVLVTIKTFWELPQGPDASGTIGYKGWYYHFLDFSTARRQYTDSWKSELSSIDTGLLLAGILYAREYFDGSDSTETLIRALADSIYLRIDWQWMMDGGSTLTHGWTPEQGMLPYRWVGYSEAMVLYILGIGAPSAPVTPSAWDSWTAGYQWKTYSGFDHVAFPPLFGHQYSHCWIDFRTVADVYMRGKGITYFENSRRATLANRAYCIANPGGYAGYGADIWGLTACDGPTGYNARGAPFGTDDGTIAPTAALASVPFTPTESISAAQAMYTQYGAGLFGPYGFRDAFSPEANWFGADYIGIDQGPIALMIENHRTQGVWNVFMKNAAVQDGLVRAGFTPVTAAEEHRERVADFVLLQNYPNPFNPSTTIRFSIPQRSRVVLSIYDAIGREVATLVNGDLPPGVHERMWEAPSAPSGVYYGVLQVIAGHMRAADSRPMILVR